MNERHRDELTENRFWLVWSNEHGAWWGPARWGYEREIARAGRYLEPEADDIVDKANKFLPEGQINEVKVLAPEALPLVKVIEP